MTLAVPMGSQICCLPAAIHEYRTYPAPRSPLGRPVAWSASDTAAVHDRSVGAIRPEEPRLGSCRYPWAFEKRRQAERARRIDRTEVRLLGARAGPRTFYACSR